MVWKLGFKRKRKLLFHLFVLSGIWACTGTDTGNPITKGGYTDETETLATGIVRDSLGRAVPECSVWVHPVSIPNTIALSKVQIRADSSKKSLVLVTDSSGTFDFIGLPSGSYSLIAVQSARGIGIKETFTIHDRDTLKLLDTATLRMVEKLTIPLKEYFGDTILIPELGIEWPVSSDTLRVMNIPQGRYSVLNKSTGNTPIASLSTETISMGPILNWNADQTQATFTDYRDSSIYSVIVQGNLVWMADNLRFPTSLSTCNPNDPYATSSCAGYGRFYSWEDAIIACPPNWHLASQEEWIQLIDAVGGIQLAGISLKARSGWTDSTNGNGTDLIGFSVLPVGSGSSPAPGNEAYFWTSSTANDMKIVTYFSAGSESASVAAFLGTDLFSVRCVSPLK